MTEIMRSYIIKLDVNGNKIIKVTPRKGSNKRGFSIQANGNLPLFNRWEKGSYYDSDIRATPEVKQLINFLKERGTTYRKSFFAACVD